MLLVIMQSGSVGTHAYQLPSIGPFLTNGVDRTNRFLMDHQPLKQHQQLFNVELPWKEVEVTVLSGYFKGCDGIVKNVRRDLKQSISLSLWIPSYRCSIDIDHSAVHEKLCVLNLC